MTEKELINACRRQDRLAQKQLYTQFAPLMYGVCRRYAKTEADVDDILVKGFMKVFKNLHQFSGDGSFEGWIRRIMVNESLMWLRKHKNLRMHVELDDRKHDRETSASVEQQLNAEQILDLLDHLPLGYKTVFNLYVVEGFSHKEIAEKLEISVNTSKSQLIKARRKLQELLQLHGYEYKQ